MTYVKANFRTKALDVQQLALGKNIANWITGSGVNVIPDGFQGGGLILASYSGAFTSGYVLMSALEVLTSAYGLTYVSNVMLPQLGGGSGTSAAVGYKFIPVAFQDSQGMQYKLSASNALTGDDSIVVIVVNSANAAASGVAKFNVFGFLVSGPFALR